MSREEVHIRDRLLMLAECSNPHKPLNVKRKSTLSKQSSKTCGPKLSMQDFVRMDPSYTPDIEHLVFPGRKRNPQQVAPINPIASKTRSRLAEMFALSRHLQQRSADRETKIRNPVVNRSVDSVLEQRSTAGLAPAAGTRSTDTSRRWVAAVEEPVRQNSSSSRLSPAAETDMATARGPNVSILHLRSTSEPWETSPTSAFSSGNTSRSYTSSTRSSGVPQLTKHQSLTGGGGGSQSYKWSNSLGFHSGGEINSTELFIGSSCNRELSPVRWCDREVDGVYLGRSGWVQVQQRSLDENRRSSYSSNLPTTNSLQPSRRTAIKLADYHCNSEPGNCPQEINRGQTEPQRPAYLSLQNRDFERKSSTPSPRNVPESFSPPSITPIISPPPAFQDKNNKKSPKTRTFFGKTPFLPRSNAIVDSDVSPPLSPTSMKWNKASSISTSQVRKQKSEFSPVAEQTPRTYSRIPQTKSLEDTTATRRTQFIQRYGESSSSSSSSMGFRSLDSCVNRPVMPRLSENTDSSVDVYEDADEEDNNSSSLNISIVSGVGAPINASILNEFNRPREKISPSSRSNRLPHHRSQNRRSPAGSDTNKAPSCTSPGSSSTSSNEFPSRSPSGTIQPSRRTPPNRQYQSTKSNQDDITSQRVRRSRSLQLPEKKTPPMFRDPSVVQSRVSPQHPDSHRVVVKLGAANNERNKRHNTKPQSFEGELLDEEMLREAEVVTGFLYGSRTKAAAQALLLHRYNNNISKDESLNDLPKPTNNGLTVYFVGNNAKKERQKTLHRGSTTPNFPTMKHVFEENTNPCNPETCDFWPHCAHRDSLKREAQFMMRSSQSYPTHQRSLDSATSENRSISAVIDRSSQDQYKKRMLHDMDSRMARRTAQSGSSSIPGEREFSERKPEMRDRRLSPNKTGISKRDAGVESVYEKKSSPVNPKSVNRGSTAGNASSSSSSSDIWMTTSDRTISKSPKNAKSSGASTPLEDVTPMLPENKPREMILTRPGSAPTEESNASISFLESQQRSMSLPKSFLSASYQQGGQFPWRRRGTESLGSSPGLPRKINTETSQTAPVTPLHEGSRRRSPLGGAARRAKATSTPQLLDPPDSENRKWTEKTETSTEARLNPSSTSRNRSNVPANAAESVLQKFRKTFSLRFQKKGSKESCNSDVGETLSEMLGEPSEEESPQHVPTVSTSNLQIDVKDEQSEQKCRFGPLIWRSSKERKKLNKAARNAKCNSGDSGIQIEMMPGCGGAGDSSESHDTDPPGDDLDSPPSVRRRPPHGKTSRPHSDLLNQILIDKFKSDLKQRAHRHPQVRRTRSDLGGQRLLHWDPRSSYRRMMSSPAPLRGRPLSPRKKPPDAPGGVQLRLHHRSRGQLRRSLSQPLDIDKLSPLMRTKTANLRLGGSNVLSEDEHDCRMGTSDEEAMSDSESSIASLNERKKSLELAMDEEMVILAEAVFDHVAIEAEELAFRAGDVIEVLETANRDWWWGSTDGRSGWFPAQFVRLRVSQEDTVEDCLAAMASGQTVPAQIRRRTSISLLSNDQVRTSVVRELVHTERDFVKVLQDVAEGYVAECRKRKDMFSEEQIRTIFINLEDILKFQLGFLKDLECSIDWEAPYKSCVGGCFLKHRSGFKMYSDYCNSHPMATASLQELYQFNNYSKFFEACRLMRGLIEIPLDGYLLTPVQRICKYPLQLAELLKYTKPDHSDYENIKEALEAMRGVAVLINERKRRMESLEKLAAWQQRVEGWEDEDLIEVSSQLIYQGEVVRVTTGMWTNNITLFLFDHQIVYCKKDILKRNTYVYKGRICLNTTGIIDVPDGKDIHLGVSVRHAIKLYSCVRDKWLLFCCRSSTDKQRWLQAFAEERKLVAQDKNDGLEFPPAARQLARMAARCQRRPPRKPRGCKNYKHNSAYMGSNLQLNSNSHNSNSLGRKVGTWFTFGGNKKSRHQHRDVS